MTIIICKASYMDSYRNQSYPKLTNPFLLTIGAMYNLWAAAFFFLSGFNYDLDQVDRERERERDPKEKTFVISFI